MLAKYASSAPLSKGRLYQENLPSISLINPFQLDKNRIIESTAFRRLEHKTQVFTSNDGDHYRNRLTHSIEAAQIAITLSNALHLSSDLAETITLAHDLGHAPFGHAGEAALIEAIKEYDIEFDHNSHTIKILTEIEEKHIGFAGLNLTWETLEGIAKHNGAFTNKKISLILKNYCDKHDLDLYKFPSLEAQISSFADDIAYNNHDIDDGYRAGLINLDDLSAIPLLDKIIKQIRDENIKTENFKLLHETMSRIKLIMIEDLINKTKENIKIGGIESLEDVRNFAKPLAEFSEPISEYHRQIKNFLMEKIYRHYSVNLMTNKAHRIVKELFHIYVNDLKCLPVRWQKNIADCSKKEAAIMVCDFIACMSDRFAISQYRSLVF